MLLLWLLPSIFTGSRAYHIHDHLMQHENKIDVWILTLTLPGPSAGVSGSLDSYCSLKTLCSGMGEVVPARTSPTLLPHPLALCCHYPVSKCRSASIAVTGTLRVNIITGASFGSETHCASKLILRKSLVRVQITHV